LPPAAAVEVDILGMGTTTIIILAVAAAIVIWFIVAYNRFVRLKKRTEEAWSDIDVQLKRRHDLIPNLVETVKGYATHEREAFENVTRARAQAISASGAAQKAEAENMLSGALKSLFAVAEAYPQLRASENFSKLQEELADTENKIQAARRFYNGNVRDLNTALEIFPSNIVAKIFGFKSAEFFEVKGEEEREPVQVKF
jgi:LemA protein